MMSKRRSFRNKKSVDYSECDGLKQDRLKYGSDDDFENDFEPPSKKTKVKNEPMKKDHKKIKCEKTFASGRLSLDDKLYERDVEKALQLSLENCGRSSLSEEKPAKDNCNKAQNGSDDGEVEVVMSSQDSNDSSSLVSSEKEKNGDYQPESETVAESEDDEFSEGGDENDSDFDAEEENKKKTTSLQKGKRNKKQRSPELPAKTKVIPAADKKADVLQHTLETKVKPSKKTKTTVIGVPPRIPGNLCSSTKPNKTTLSSVRSPLSAVSGKSPSFGLGGVVIKNPGPPIRVGLSRKKKVKPLHLNIAVAR